MSRFKKIASLLMAATMTLTATVSALAFDDLENHWAKEYMEDLNDRGFLNGYPDDTMRPDGEITFVETLTLLSRFYELEDEEMEYANADFEEIAVDYLPESMDWATDEVVMCLAAGIITENELEVLPADEPVNKETISVLLVRALQLEEDAAELAKVDLGFADSDEVTDDYTGYIALLVYLKVVTGDEENNFNPKQGLSRAVAATFVSRGIEYIEENDIELVVEDYVGLTKANGIIQHIGTSSMQVRGFHGLITEYELTGDEIFVVNGEEDNPSAEYEGDYVEISFEEEEISKISVEIDKDIDWYQGEIIDLNDRNDVTIEILDFFTEDEDEFEITSDTEISIDGDEEDYDELDEGMFATLKVVDDELEIINAIDADYDLDATITSISYGTTINLRVIDSNDMTYIFPIDATDIPEIMRGDSEITIDRLAIGDEVTIELNAAVPVSIEASASRKGIEGELVAITSTATGTSWTIEEDGDSSTYMLDALADAYIGEKDVDISDVKIGDKISILIYGNVITEVEILSEYSSTDKISGTIIVVDEDADQLTLLSNNRLIYVDARGATIISAETGTTHSIDDLRAELTVTIYGDSTSNTSMDATSIIVES